MEAAVNSHHTRGVKGGDRKVDANAEICKILKVRKKKGGNGLGGGLKTVVY